MIFHRRAQNICTYVHIARIFLGRYFTAARHEFIADQLLALRHRHELILTLV